MLNKKARVIFIGAGPGDPELLTLKGKAAIENADFIIYAGSLVPPAIIALARPEVPTIDSATLTLEESHELIKKAIQRGELVARIHTGDPSLYGALPEQIDLLDRDGIAWEIIPGITAACAAAAAAGISFTKPEISQSLIITRQAGRTPMPPSEALAALASHHSSMAIYLSGKIADEVQLELARSLPLDTPIFCAHKLGWPEQKLLWTRLGELAHCVQKNGLQSQTVFLVLPSHDKSGSTSRLYNKNFSHQYRISPNDTSGSGG